MALWEDLSLLKSHFAETQVSHNKDVEKKLKDIQVYLMILSDAIFGMDNKSNAKNHVYNNYEKSDIYDFKIPSDMQKIYVKCTDFIYKICTGMEMFMDYSERISYEDKQIFYRIYIYSIMAKFELDDKGLMVDEINDEYMEMLFKKLKKVAYIQIPGSVTVRIIQYLIRNSNNEKAINFLEIIISKMEIFKRNVAYYELTSLVCNLNVCQIGNREKYLLCKIIAGMFVNKGLKCELEENMSADEYYKTAYMGKYYFYMFQILDDYYGCKKYIEIIETSIKKINIKEINIPNFKNGDFVKINIALILFRADYNYEMGDYQKAIELYNIVKLYQKIPGFFNHGYYGENADMYFRMFNLSGYANPFKYNYKSIQEYINGVCAEIEEPIDIVKEIGADKFKMGNLDMEDFVESGKQLVDEINECALQKGYGAASSAAVSFMTMYEMMQYLYRMDDRDTYEKYYKALTDKMTFCKENYRNCIVYNGEKLVRISEKQMSDIKADIDRYRSLFDEE